MTTRYLVCHGESTSEPVIGYRWRRSKLVDEGYSDVAVLQSGNVIVSSDAGAMQRLLSDQFDVEVPCLIRTTNQVRKTLACNPLQEVVSDPSRYLVNFLSEVPDPEVVQALLEENHSPEVIAIEGTEAYVWTPNGVKAMTLSYAYLEKRFGSAATARNWSTLDKIVARF